MLRDKIQAEAQTQAQAEAEATAATQGPPASSTVGGAMAPVMQLEKGDVEFWLTVAQVVLLYLIYREMKRGGSL